MLDNQLVAKFTEHTLKNMAKMIYSSVGLAMLFVIVGIMEKHRIASLPQWGIQVGGLCMGVYLFQQFILMGIYSYTSLSSVTNPYVMPWIAFAVALFGSLFLSYIFRLTKIGRFLIG